MAEVLDAPIENKTKTVDNTTNSDDALVSNFVKTIKAQDEKRDANKEKNTPVANTAPSANIPVNQIKKDIVDAPGSVVEETEEQKQIKILTAQKEAIQNDLKLSEIERVAALKKLEPVKEKQYWESPDFDTPSSVVEKTAENKEEDLAALKLKVKKLEEIESDQFYKSYVSAKESGKDVATFLTEIAKDNPASLTDEQIWEKRISRFGLTEDEAAEERDHLKSMSPTSRKESIAKERQLLNQEYQKNFEKYSTNNAAEREQALSVAKQAIKETNDYLSSIQGKEVRGIVYDSTQTQKLAGWAKNVMENGLFRKDGSWDVPTIMQLGMLKLNAQHMLQKAFEKGETSANEKWHQTYARPSKDNGIGKIPDASIINKDKSQQEAENEAWKKKNLS